MPVYQSASNAIVAYKAQSGLGSQASGGSGLVLRTAGGQGGRMTSASVESNEVRADGMRFRGRQGTQKTNGQWAHEGSIGSHETIIQAVMRDTWSSADVALTEASGSLTSITTTTSTIVNGGGSWITQGVKVGDIWRLTGHATAGNNGRNLRVTAVTTDTITVAEPLTLNATPDTAFTLTRSGKKLIQSGTLVKRYFTVDEYEADIDQSEVLTDFVWSGLRMSMQPNGLFMMEPGGVGTGQFDALATGSSPLLTSPTSTTGTSLSVADATIRLPGGDAVDLTSLDITLDIGAVAPDVFGTNGIKYAPDVFTGQLGIGVNFTCLRKDMQFVQDFTAETQYAIHLLLVENEAEPKDFISCYIGNFTLGAVNKSPLSRQAGPRTQSIESPAARVGIDTTGTSHDATMIKFQSTGA